MKSILLEKYGKESEIVKAYTKEILDLPPVLYVSLKKICKFGEKLIYCVQALQTMTKLKQVNGAVSMMLDKLPAIWGYLARTNPNWEEWDVAQLSEAICLWIRRNSVDTSQREQEQQVKRNIPSSDTLVKNFSCSMRCQLKAPLLALHLLR